MFTTKQLKCSIIMRIIWQNSLIVCALCENKKYWNIKSFFCNVSKLFFKQQMKKLKPNPVNSTSSIKIITILATNSFLFHHLYFYIFYYNYSLCLNSIRSYNFVSLILKCFLPPKDYFCFFYIFLEREKLWKEIYKSFFFVLKYFQEIFL